MLRGLRAYIRDFPSFSSYYVAAEYFQKFLHVERKEKKYRLSAMKRGEKYESLVCIDLSSLIHAFTSNVSASKPVSLTLFSNSILVKQAYVHFVKNQFIASRPS